LKQGPLLIAGFALLACAPQRAPRGPEPITSLPPAAPEPPPPLPPPPPTPVEVHPDRSLPDSLLLRKLAADSVEDSKILDKLHEVTASTDSGLGTEAETDLAEMFDINVVRYADHARVKFYLDFFQGPARSRMAIWLERLPYYEPMIRTALQARGLPSDLVYLGLIESGYSNTAVSRSRAVGMWQFMRATGKEYGLLIDKWVDERRDPIKATHAAARYLADLTSRFHGSHYLAAAAYNGGGGRVSRGLRKMGITPVEEDEEEDSDGDGEPDEFVADDRFFQLSGSRYLKRETKDYVPKLIAAAMIAKQPDKFDFSPIAAVEPYAVDSVPVTEATSLEVIARASEVPVAEIVALNPHYIRQITPPARIVWVRVPPGRGVSTTEALAAIPSAERIPSFKHVVRAKESLRSVARRYNLTPAELASLNPDLQPDARLKPGTELRVPGLSRVRGWAVADQRETSARGARRSSGGYHRVRNGETLGAIARRYGVSVGQLQAMNELGSSTTIRVGQRLRVGSVRRPVAGRRPATRVTASRAPAAGSAGAGATHLVQRGETLSSLARRYGVTVNALMEANGLRSARALKAGTRLTIPS